MRVNNEDIPLEVIIDLCVALRQKNTITEIANKYNLSEQLVQDLYDGKINSDLKEVLNHLGLNSPVIRVDIPFVHNKSRLISFIRDLHMTNMTILECSKFHGISPEAGYKINSGLIPEGSKQWVKKEGYLFPIRTTLQLGNMTNEQFLAIAVDLQDNELALCEIALKHRVTPYIISCVNKGKLKPVNVEYLTEMGFSFPIGLSRRTFSYRKSDVLSLLHDLRYTDKANSMLASEYALSNITISRFNKGDVPTHVEVWAKEKGYTFPIREAKGCVINDKSILLNIALYLAYTSYSVEYVATIFKYKPRTIERVLKGDLHHKEILFLKEHSISLPLRKLKDE